MKVKNDKMRVAIITLYNPFEKINGGIESVVYHLSISMANLGIETWILTMGSVDKCTIKNQNGVNIWIIPDKGYKGLFLRNLIFIKEGRRLIRKMNKKYNINIFNGQAGYSSPLAFTEVDGKVILTVHTIDGENFADIKDFLRNKKYMQCFIEIIKFPILKLWRLFYFLKADNLIFVSKTALHEFIRFYPLLDKKKYVIENGSPKLDDLKIYGLKFIEKENNFIYVGRIDRRKMVDLIIKAADLLNKDRLKFNILIVGDGLYKRYCEILTDNLNLKNFITFTGYASYEDLLKYISRSKFLILPSSYESDPLVIKESFQLGVPVIVSDIYANRERVTDGENGFFFNNKDYFDLYQKMKYTLTIEQDYISLSSNAKKGIRNKTWDAVAKKYIELFRKI